MTDRRPVAVITGTGGAVGGATVRDLAVDHKVIALARTVESAEHLLEYGTVEVVPVDLEDAAVVERVAAELAEKYPKIRLLVHAAALAYGEKLSDTDADIWARTFAVNVTAPALLTRGLLASLKSGGAEVIFINSGAGHNSFPDHTAYAASKHALKSVANSLRLGEKGIRVTTIYPGQIDSKMLRGLNDYFEKPFTPGRYIRPESVAETIRFIAQSPADVHLTNIDVRPAGMM